LVDFLELLERDVFEGQGPGFHDAADIVLFDIERQNLDELQDLDIEVMVVHFEMPRAHIDSTTLRIGIQRKEFLQNEHSILEVRVRYLESQLNEHIIVLVVHDAEAVAFQHFSVCHATIAQKDLRAFGECVLTGLHIEFVLRWHIVNDLVPDCFGHVFAHLDLLLACVTAADFTHLSELARPGPHSLVSQRFLLDEQI